MEPYLKQKKINNEKFLKISAWYFGNWQLENHQILALTFKDIPAYKEK